MRSGKHAPTRFSQYIKAHDNVLGQFVREGFVAEDHGLEFEAVPGGLLLEGRLECEGGIRIDVTKLVAYVIEDTDPLVETRRYRYHVTLRGAGNVFRYDSPHETHNREHHVHRYDLLDGDRRGEVTFLHDEEEVPTLGEVIEEARQWYWANLEDLQDRGLA